MAQPLIRSEFDVHILNEKGLEAARGVAAAFSALLNTLDELAPGPSREKSIVVTTLQEAGFWAKRAVAIRPENQKAPEGTTP